MSEARNDNLPVVFYKEISENLTTQGKTAKMPVLEVVGEDGALKEYIFQANLPIDIRTERGLRYAAGFGALVSTAIACEVRFGPRVETGRISDSLDRVPTSNLPGIGLYLDRSDAIISGLTYELWLKKQDPKKIMADFERSLSVTEDLPGLRRLAVESISLLPRF